MAPHTTQWRPIARTVTAISTNPPMSTKAIARPDMADIVALDCDGGHTHFLLRSSPCVLATWPRTTRWSASPTTR